MSGRLPLDLEREILSRLPAKQLIGFRCVCKRWHDEIITPDFIKSHTCQVHKAYSNNNGSLILFGGGSSSFLLCMDLHAPSKTLTRHRLPISTMPPFNKLYYSSTLIGSSNGLLCFEGYFWEAFWRPLIYSLHNPITNPNYIYTTPPLTPEIAYISGFGYDCMSDDYKILCISPFDKKSYVYSLKSNSWKFIQPPFPIPPSFPKKMGSATMVLSNNALHFILYDSNLRTIRVCSFDLGTEEYHEVLQFDDDNDSNWFLAELKGCLHLFRYSKFCMRFWVLKNYSTEQSGAIIRSKKKKKDQSWANLVHNDYVISDQVVLDNDRFRRYYPGLNEPPRPYAYSEDGSEILMVLGRGKKSISIVRCNLRSGELAKEAIFGLPKEWRDVKRFDVLPWIGSLVVLPFNQK